MAVSRATLFIARDPEPLSSLPQALSADTEFLREFRLVHRILMLQHKSLEVILKR